ncbi:hypothetical protein Q5P01_007318 [Channa striata]|uniref:Uncharacterized protein n=1 Tax=Channa striata TaxID=64152 RepID=A0AA88N921_CHASR|nr:hypothetical protein Q5P01_007318 [Channa striata]
MFCSAGFSSEDRLKNYSTMRFSLSYFCDSTALPFVPPCQVQSLGRRAVKGTLFPPAADREPLQHTGGAEKETLCVCMRTEGREMAIDPNEGDGSGEGPTMCTSAFHNISAFSDLTIKVATRNQEQYYTWA